MKNILSLLITVIVSLNSQGQNSSQETWYFGSHAGLEFGSSSASALTDANPLMIQEEMAVSQSDPQGRLLFYSNGRYIFDKTHTLVAIPSSVTAQWNPLNGTGPFQDKLPCPSNMQTFTCKVPLSNTDYFMAAPCGYQLPLTNTYSIIKVNSSQYVDATASSWNLNFPAPPLSSFNLGEGMTGIPSCDNSRIWILANDASGGQIHIYELTSSSTLNYQGSFSFPWVMQGGYFNVSPDGTYVTFTNHGNDISIFDFDRDLGVISNRRKISSGTVKYQPAFSPNSEYLYVPLAGLGKIEIVQYDLANECIESSGEIIEVNKSSGIPLILGLGPNGKIYTGHNNENYVGVINLPDVRVKNKNNACDFVSNAISLGQSSKITPAVNNNMGFGFPNLFDAVDAPYNLFKFKYYVTNCRDVAFTPILGCNTSSPITWDYGDGTSPDNLANHVYASPGTYSVTAVSGSLTYTHDITIGLEAEIYGDFNICVNNNPSPFVETYETRYSPSYSYAWNPTGGIVISTNKGSAEISWIPGTYKKIELTIIDNLCSRCTTIVSQEISDDCIIYVDLNSTSGLKDGTSWTDAFLDVQVALNSISFPFINSYEIWVADGTYYATSSGNPMESIELINSVRIYGGFVGNERFKINRDYSNNLTVLSGYIDPSSNSYHVISSNSNDPSAVLDGFQITKGVANGSSPSQKLGGGMLIENGNPAIVNCWFYQNSANKGGGIYSDHGSNSASVHNNKFESNSASIEGGAIYVDGPGISTEVISIYNNLFCNNSAIDDGGAIYTNSNSTTYIVNCNFGGNSSTNGTSALFFNLGPTHVYNSIIWDGQTPAYEFMGGPGALGTIHNSSFIMAAPIPNIYNNIATDPNYTGGCDLKTTEIDFRDAGNNSLFLTSYNQIDFNGFSRIYGGTIDMGAYEFDPTNARLGNPKNKSNHGQENVKSLSIINSNLTIYPNPSSGELNIEFENPDLDNIQIRVYNTLGDIVLESEIKSDSEFVSEKFDLQTSGKGIYFIQIQIGDKMYTEKVIIN